RGFPRPKGATPIRLPLVPAYRACTSSNRTHGAPLSFGSCSPPILRSDYLTIGTPDSNGKGANSIGSVQFTVQPDNPATSADEADVLVNGSLTDVRNQGTLTDYAGQLQLGTSVRITDRDNGGADGARPPPGPG